MPLFPGYVFARIERQDLHRLYSIPAFMHVAGRGNTPEPVEESDIDAIRQLVAAGSGVAPWPFCTAGQMVEVTHGPLAGLRGVFLRTKGQDRLVVSLPILQRSVATEIDSGNVRPLSVLSDRAGAA